MEDYNHFKWKHNYSVKIHKLDKQHKEIITLVRDLSQLCVIDDNESHETFKLMLLSAIQYFKYHFFEEEILMHENNYHAYLEHKEKHDKMYQEINKMVDRKSVV